MGGGKAGDVADPDLPASVQDGGGSKGMVEKGMHPLPAGIGGFFAEHDADQPLSPAAHGGR